MGRTNIRHGPRMDIIIQSSRRRIDQYHQHFGNNELLSSRRRVHQHYKHCGNDQLLSRRASLLLVLQLQQRIHRRYLFPVKFFDCLPNFVQQRTFGCSGVIQQLLVSHCASVNLGIFDDRHRLHNHLHHDMPGDVVHYLWRADLHEHVSNHIAHH